MAAPLRVDLLGAGTIARQHAEAAYASGREIRLSAADPSPRAREAFAAAFPSATLYEEVGELLSVPAREGDIAVVATPPWLHREQIEQAAHAGRHVLCEKPLLLSSADLEPVGRALRTTGRTLVSCSTRFLRNPATLEVRERIRKGELGELYSVRWRHGMQRMRSGIEWQPESPWFLDASKNGGGCLMDWAPYDLAVLHDLLEPGAVTIAEAVLARPELPAELPAGTVFDVETHGAATLIFERQDGSRVPVHYERFTGSFAPDVEESTLTGTRASISWTSLGFAGKLELTLRRAGEEKGTRRGFDPPGESWFRRAPLFEMLALLEGRPHRAVAGRNALFQAAVLRAIYRAARTGEAVTVRADDFGDVPEAGPACC